MIETIKSQNIQTQEQVNNLIVAKINELVKAYNKIIR